MSVAWPRILYSGEVSVCPMKRNVGEFGECDGNPSFEVFDSTKCYIGNYCGVHSNIVITVMEEDNETLTLRIIKEEEE